MIHFLIIRISEPPYSTLKGMVCAIYNPEEYKREYGVDMKINHYLSHSLCISRCLLDFSRRLW